MSGATPIGVNTSVYRPGGKAIDHHARCVEVMRATGSTDLKLWLPDGTKLGSVTYFEVTDRTLPEAATTSAEESAT